MGKEKDRAGEFKIKELEQESIILSALNEILEERLKSAEKTENEIQTKKEREQESELIKGLTNYGLFSDLKRSERRNKLELYYDILLTISQEATRGQVKPTRIQFLSNTTYDRLMKYLNILQAKGLIALSPITLTERGRQFLKDYEKTNYFSREIGSNYL